MGFLAEVCNILRRGRWGPRMQGPLTAKHGPIGFYKGRPMSVTGAPHEAWWLFLLNKKRFRNMLYQISTGLRCDFRFTRAEFDSLF